MNIYVGNLNFEVQMEDLKQIFEEYGEVSSAKIIVDKATGESKGFGFVEMANDAEARVAIEELNGATLMNREMKVNEARPKKTTSQRPSNRSGNRPNRDFRERRNFKSQKPQ